MLFFFFFKQKTAYEMRISDWSSDVCSSDLLGALIVDMMLIVGALIVFTLLVIWLGIASRSDIMVSIWMLGGFLLRNFWFIGFELGQRAATPGKIGRAHV